MQLFDAIKQAVTAEQAAVRYAKISPTRKGNRSWACCPFHADDTPSLMFDEEGRFYCFSCNATGSAIDFVAQLYQVDPMKAAQMIAKDFRIAPTTQTPIVKAVRPAVGLTEQRAEIYRRICDAKRSAHDYHSKRTAQEGEAALDDQSVIDAILLEAMAESEWLDTLYNGSDEEASALSVRLQGAVGGI